MNTFRLGGRAYSSPISRNTVKTSEKTGETGWEEKHACDKACDTASKTVILKMAMEFEGLVL
jgi:hypothetical protein